MYLRHFALTRLPFETPAHTDELFESNARREAEARLQHLIELKGIGLLTGEVGSGKTTVCRHVAAALHPGLYRVGYVSLTTGNVLDMYKSIAWELGLPTERSRATAYRAIRAEITRRVCEAKQLPILVIDEAQHLRNDVLEDLRLLTNFAMDSENRLCLLLVGLTELRRRLAMAARHASPGNDCARPVDRRTDGCNGGRRARRTTGDRWVGVHGAPRRPHRVNNAALFRA